MNSKVVYLKDYQRKISIKGKDIKRQEMREKMRNKMSEKYKKRK
ncbi:hypothetical protein QWY22_03655 [Planococcus liqunii]|nr:hypothetical protein [Planococcus sp. N056]WKA51712.1 hypothetical protein QWY22_03655 [Planococcus sp. N056]